MKDQTKTTKIYCNHCQQKTNHYICAEHLHDLMDYSFHRVYFLILECCGCESVSFNEVTMRYDEVSEVENSVIYPPRNPKPIKEFNNIPDKLSEIYKEIVICFNSQVFILCAAGLRALVEGICDDKNIKKGTVIDQETKTPRTSKFIDGKINGLAEKGILTENQAKTLHNHRFLGNDAMHDLEVPDNESLLAAIEILEHTLEAIYDISHKEKKIQIKKKQSAH